MRRLVSRWERQATDTRIVGLPYLPPVKRPLPGLTMVWRGKARSAGEALPLRRGLSLVRLSVIMYTAIPAATWEVTMNFLQDRRVLWGGAVIIVVIVLAVVYGDVVFGWLGGETPPAQ